MTRIIDDLALVFSRCPEQCKHGLLRGLRRIIIVEFSVQHEDGNPDPGNKIDLIHLRQSSLEVKPRDIKDSSLETFLDCRNDGPHGGSPTVSKIGDLILSDFSPCLGIIDRSWGI